jgi:hypothetical protein
MIAPFRSIAQVGWLPQRRSALLVLFVALFAAAGSFAVVFTSASRDFPLSGSDVLQFLFFCVVFGGAAGCLVGSVALPLNAAVSRMDQRTPVWEPAPKAFVSAAIFFAAHSFLMGVLYLVGAWKPPGPWFLGLLVYEWARWTR